MTIYVCSRYRADTAMKFEEQLTHTKEISRIIVKGGFDVIVPHLYYTQFLDDNIEAERKIGIESATRLVTICDALFVSIKDGVSVGMEAEINTAKENNKDIYYFRNKNELLDLLKKLI